MKRPLILFAAATLLINTGAIAQSDKKQATPPPIDQMPDPGFDVGQYILKNRPFRAIEGKVAIRFIVTEDGSLDSISVVRSTDSILEKDALKLVQDMPKWKPGMYQGKPVRVPFTLPITFTVSR